MEQRKNEHLDIVLNGNVEHGQTTLLECVELLHQSLPELNLDQVNTEVRAWGRTSASPLFIVGMTGGSERAGEINRRLAEVAQTTGTTLGVGSMRPILNQRTRLSDYDLRRIAPDIALLGNIGVMQAQQIAVSELADLLRELKYDALCIHLNPAQELAQREGDRDFRGAVETITRYVGELGLPVIVKETGAGMSTTTLDQIKSTGAHWVDVSGRGGTSWTKVESLRPNADFFGADFANWGVPTAVSTIWAVERGFKTMASGGLRNALDALRALALGATFVGAARPVLLELENGGIAAATTAIRNWQEGIRRGLLLCGCRNLDELKRKPKVILPPLRDWLAII